MPKKEEKIKALEEKIKGLENGWKRALADYANLEKRIKREREDFRDFTCLNLLVKLLSVVDDLERSQEHLKDQGLGLVVTRFKEILKSEGLVEMDPKGRDFDPKSMEVVEVIKGPKNKVMETLAKGYSFNDEVLRPAKVKVGKSEKGK